MGLYFGPQETQRVRTTLIRQHKYIWKSETVDANQVTAINPPIDDTDPIRTFSVDARSHTNLQNPAEFSSKGKPIRNFSIDPTSSIRTRRLRTPFLRTPFPINLAHRNRSDFCDLRLRCRPQTPEIASDFRHKTKQCCVAIYKGCDGMSLAICELELRFPSLKPLLSAGNLAIWVRQRGNR